MKKKRVEKESIKGIEEKLFNVPNTLSILRVLMTFVIVYLIIIGEALLIILSLFIIAAITDFLDGQIARRFNQKTEFGRKADIIADRFLWVGTALAFIITLSLKKDLSQIHGLQFLLVMSREIVSAPSAIYSLLRRRPIPHAIFIGKLTTFLQGFAIPLIILSVFYSKIIYLSFPLACVTSIIGIFSGIQYMKDVSKF